MGVTEKHIASRISYLFKQEGGDGDSYDPIIASGANGALPHATPSDKGVEKGDFIVMDFGALYNGYHADMTRTVLIGKPSQKHKEIYQIVLEQTQLTKISFYCNFYTAKRTVNLKSGKTRLCEKS